MASRRGGMRHLKERLMLAGLVIVVPIVFGILVVRPILKRIDGYKQRFREASSELEVLPQFMPVSPGEREILDDPKAGWRKRMPVLPGEQARLAHYHRVVSDLQRTWKGVGVSVSTLRSSWDPIRASFTLPNALDSSDSPGPTLSDSAELKVHGWVIEAQLPAPTEALFRALAAVPLVEPLLEPVGLRWESYPEHRQQSLLLRNLVVTP